MLNCNRKSVLREISDITLPSGIRNQESGIRNQESGIRNQESKLKNKVAINIKAPKSIDFGASLCKTIL